MAVVASHHIAQSITAHAWNATLSMIALCPNTSEVHIYTGTPAPDSVWEKAFVLQKHDQLVSGIDWAPISNYIVTCSHDRNSYVWSFDGTQWQPTLVILRLNRAAISVDWSPKENKFVVGSGAKSVCVCYYEADNNWWVSKIIRKKHGSTVTGVAWHPNNLLIATTSTDCKCRVFSAYIKGVDSKINPGTTFVDTKFGEQVLQLDLAFGWSFGVKWSPTGNSLAYVDFSLFVRLIDSLISGAHILFLSETRLVGGGFDCNPMLFEIDPKRGVWTFVKFVDEAKSSTHDLKSSTLFLEAMGRFHGQTRRGTHEAFETSRASGLAHDNCITCIVPLISAGEVNGQETGEKVVQAFSTSGVDGRLIIWSFSNITELLAKLQI
ncbi:hypothetical protein AXG93_1862s1000 [Marchantia polymorpha subsp. ruderalis]|uniref:Arp2/3 complex 41 kDa subunit n=1 Tax=Marchantia polymorpha subsp. ruderalis TaxID=1480154 RepID=A0A176W906_MARPO|nr:hypothetical protein AXG93_1862s1000 [Marchantia polymorpha subsp. ruderalis]